MFTNLSIYSRVMGLLALGTLAACGAGEDDPGMEYAPQMYHSVAYEPLTQITDESEGEWLSSRADGRGEFFNSNVNNPHAMNMRQPAPNTVKRNDNNLLPYRIEKDEMGDANLQRAAALKSPLDTANNEQLIAEGRVLYTNFCYHCHGAGGQGDGPVGEIYKGVANISGAGQLASVTEGHIFHVITHGKGRMWPHASQIDPVDRWKIARYIKEDLQKK
jgi:mono/diheme cytochrome c family protein